MEQRPGVFIFITVLVPLVLPVPLAPAASPDFIVIQQTLTWPDAQTFCLTHHTGLANIRSAADAARIKNLFLTEGLTSWAWMGLYNNMSSWKWSMDGSPVGSFTPWDPSTSEPNNMGGNQLCVAMYANGWWDAECYRIFQSVCYDGSKSGNSRYILVTALQSWTDAQIYCRTNHDDLVSIRDATEFAIVQNIINGDTWIGLYRDGWKWTDTSNSFPIKWASTEPENFYGDENCGDYDTGRMYDDSCTDTAIFVCSTQRSSVQMFRLKMESDVNVNDPAVMETILQQMKLKLVLLGLSENIQLTWKIRPNGTTFKKIN